MRSSVLSQNNENLLLLEDVPVLLDCDELVPPVHDVVEVLLGVVGAVATVDVLGHQHAAAGLQPALEYISYFF